jgi:hypothetical protein
MGREIYFHRNSVLNSAFEHLDVGDEVIFSEEAEEFLHKLEIPHHQPPLIGVEKVVDFRLADWLLKGDARQHLEGRRCHFKIPARCWLKYAARVLLWTSVVRSETTPLRIRN